MKPGKLPNIKQCNAMPKYMANPLEMKKKMDLILFAIICLHLLLLLLFHLL